MIYKLTYLHKLSSLPFASITGTDKQSPGYERS